MNSEEIAVLSLKDGDILFVDSGAINYSQLRDALLKHYPDKHWVAIPVLTTGDQTVLDCIAVARHEVSNTIGGLPCEYKVVDGEICAVVKKSEIDKKMYKEGTYVSFVADPDHTKHITRVMEEQN